MRCRIAPAPATSRDPLSSSRPHRSTNESSTMRLIIFALSALSVGFVSPALAQSTPLPPQRQSPAPAGAELAACKATALLALAERDASIKDIYFDEDAITVADANTKVEDTPIRHIIMGEAYLQTNKQDKPRRFLCLIGEKGKVLLTFFTAR
jgi:hypothetical protein